MCYIREWDSHVLPSSQWWIGFREYQIRSPTSFAYLENGTPKGDSGACPHSMHILTGVEQVGNLGRYCDQWALSPMNTTWIMPIIENGEVKSYVMAETVDVDGRRWCLQASCYGTSQKSGRWQASQEQKYQTHRRRADYKTPF